MSSNVESGESFYYPRDKTTASDIFLVGLLLLIPIGFICIILIFIDGLFFNGMHLKRGPEISGRAVAGQVLRADPGYYTIEGFLGGVGLKDHADKNSTASLGPWAYDWQICKNGGCHIIPNAHSDTYLVQDADRGKSVRVIVYINGEASGKMLYKDWPHYHSSFRSIKP
jgi:hypothetical protein